MAHMRTEFSLLVAFQSSEKDETHRQTDGETPGRRITLFFQDAARTIIGLGFNAQFTLRVGLGGVNWTNYYFQLHVFSESVPTMQTD